MWVGNGTHFGYQVPMHGDLVKRSYTTHVNELHAQTGFARHLYLWRTRWYGRGVTCNICVT